MTRIIKHRECHSVTYHTLFYQSTFEAEGSGWAFDCDEHGNVDVDSLEPLGRDSYAQCRLGRVHVEQLDGEIKVVPVMKPEIKEYTHRVCENAVMECDCGAELELYDPMTNRCNKCGRFYNGSGQLLAHPSQWGEETGERFNDEGQQIL